MSLANAPYLAVDIADGGSAGPANYDVTQLSNVDQTLASNRILARAIEKNTAGTAAVARAAGIAAAATLATAVGVNLGVVATAKETMETAKGVWQASAKLPADLVTWSDAVDAYNLTVQSGFGQADAVANNEAYYGPTGQPDVGISSAPVQPASILA